MRKSFFDAPCQITFRCIILFSHRIALRKANRISTNHRSQPWELNGHTKKPGRMNYRTYRNQSSIQRTKYLGRDTKTKHQQLRFGDPKLLNMSL